MTQESRKTADSIIKSNCGSCCHSRVCHYKGGFDSVVKRVIHEAQADDYLAEVYIKCKHHMFTGGTSFLIGKQKDGVDNAE